MPRCNCENSVCPVCDGRGCKNHASGQRALYIGPICDGCADHMPAKYLLPKEISSTTLATPMTKEPND